MVVVVAQRLTQRSRGCHARGSRGEPLLHEVAKFILDITDIGEGKHREEIWVYNQHKSEIANPSIETVAINGDAFSL